MYLHINRQTYSHATQRDVGKREARELEKRGDLEKQKRRESEEKKRRREREREKRERDRENERHRLR